MHPPIRVALWLRRYLTPANLLIISFAGAILAGTFGLMLPGSTTKGEIRFIDALFTSTSAVCVTGLTVVDTGTYYTRSGQVIILCLIQMGGLGIMTFSVVILVLSGRRISIRDKLIVKDSFVPVTSTDFYKLIKRIFVSTFTIESIGAISLWTLMPDRTLFSSIFHAISAFCNAGFALKSRSMMDYCYNTGVNLTICALIVLGGLGFFSHVELGKRLLRKQRRMSLHTRLVLVVTSVLILVGAITFYAFESRNTLRGESLRGVVLISLFQSITARTAGFNTIDLGTVTNATLYMVILLMFIGASPGSTGGGIKTTTLGVLFAMARSRYRGEESVHVFNRTVPYETVSRALSVLVLGFTLVTFSALALSFVEIGEKPYLQSSISFIALFFEVVSAFGTVGLSTGITPSLSDLGKFILVLVMFVGRVGPLTIVTAVGRHMSRAKFRYAEENVMVG